MFLHLKYLSSYIPDASGKARQSFVWSVCCCGAMLLKCQTWQNVTAGSSNSQCRIKRTSVWQFRANATGEFINTSVHTVSKIHTFCAHCVQNTYIQSAQTCAHCVQNTYIQTAQTWQRVGENIVSCPSGRTKGRHLVICVSCCCFDLFLWKFWQVISRAARINDTQHFVWPKILSSRTHSGCQGSNQSES